MKTMYGQVLVHDRTTAEVVVVKMNYALRFRPIVLRPFVTLAFIRV